mgnify:CR=1 FL=1
MDYPSLPWEVKIGAGVFLFLSITAGYIIWANHQQGIGEARATAKYNTLIDAQKKEAAGVLARETARVVAAERALQDFKNSQEVKDAGNKKTVDNLTARLRGLAVNGRLRDPHADPGCGGGGGGSNGTDSTGSRNRPDNGTASSGVLSAELSGLLGRLLKEADEINNAYISCRADAEAVRAK